MESEVAEGLGAGSFQNRLISKSQEESATNSVAVGFAEMANNVCGEGIAAFEEDGPWAFSLSIVVALAVAILAKPVKGDFSKKIKMYVPVSPTLSSCNWIWSNDIVPSRIKSEIKRRGRITFQSTHYCVVKVRDDEFERIVSCFGLDIENVSGDPVEGGSTSPGGVSDHPGSNQGDEQEHETSRVRSLIEYFDRVGQPDAHAPGGGGAAAEEVPPPPEGGAGAASSGM